MNRDFTGMNAVAYIILHILSVPPLNQNLKPRHVKPWQLLCITLSLTSLHIWSNLHLKLCVPSCLAYAVHYSSRNRAIDQIWKNKTNIDRHKQTLLFCAKIYSIYCIFYHLFIVIAAIKEIISNQIEIKMSESSRMKFWERTHNKCSSTYIRKI